MTWTRLRQVAFVAHDLDAVVADLFAGSGAMGIEALSRGAARCVFVERDRALLFLNGIGLFCLSMLIGWHWMFALLGEIAAVGPSVHMGYLDNPAVNREAFTQDGWFRTGDLGQFVDKDYLAQLTADGDAGGAAPAARPRSRRRRSAGRARTTAARDPGR